MKKLLASLLALTASGCPDVKTDQDEVGAEPTVEFDPARSLATVEYKLISAKAAVRAGFIYDPTPIPSTTLSARLPAIAHARRHHWWLVEAGADQRWRRDRQPSLEHVYKKN